MELLCVFLVFFVWWICHVIDQAAVENEKQQAQHDADVENIA